MKCFFDTEVYDSACQTTIKTIFVVFEIDKRYAKLLRNTTGNGIVL